MKIKCTKNSSRNSIKLHTQKKTRLVRMEIVLNGHLLSFCIDTCQWIQKICSNEEHVVSLSLLMKFVLSSERSTPPKLDLTPIEIHFLFFFGFSIKIYFQIANSVIGTIINFVFLWIENIFVLMKKKIKHFYIEN